ncbi:MAG: hypothetical protein OEL56_04535 [Nitrosopumilus sp.]|nr:hypothetical protein [Nitrosopumilus sp.]MDH3515914.1 hypothetical protein [Nitrosopumilus sp.]MDH3564838.1 hypothetical protein [Nitrosopumilus sp.]MDH5417228.1 hypothetical protein [Nitrosopumilus sp.]MDH5554630.1 hypothetical protein [Nitrosopumilus sp.]
MNIEGLYMLKSVEYSEEKIHEAIKILYTDRKNEFQELAQVILGEKTLKEMSNWKEFILNFSLDVGDSFKTWTGQKPPSGTSPQKALTILRKVGNGKTSMNQLTHLLNIAYNLSSEFKEIYRRLK